MIYLVPHNYMCSLAVLFWKYILCKKIDNSHHGRSGCADILCNDFFYSVRIFRSEKNGCTIFLSHHQRRTSLKQFHPVCINNTLFPPEYLYYGRIDKTDPWIGSTRGLWMQVLTKKRRGCAPCVHAVLCGGNMHSATSIITVFLVYCLYNDRRKTSRYEPRHM